MQTETLLEAACSSMPSIFHSGQESIVDVVSHFGKTCQVHSVLTKAQTLHKWLASWQDLTTLTPPPNGWGSEGAAVGDAGMLEWAILDAQFHGLAQRRRRVFAIVDFGDWESRQPILLERESLRGDTPPSRETRQEIAGTTEIGTGSCSCSHIDIVAGTQSALMVAFGEYSEDGSASTLKMRDYKDATDLVYALAGNTIGRKPENGGNGNGFDDSGVSYTLTKTDLHGVCYRTNAAGQILDQGSITATLNIKSQVRRLTPVECARLQGFKDNYLDIEFKGKPAADSHKYKALGNSMAVPVMRYIGLRVLAAMETEQGGFTQ